MDPLQATWSDQQGVARLAIGSLAAQVPLDSPGDGANRITWDCKDIQGVLFRSATSSGALPPASEHYFRGNDFITIHTPEEEWPFRTQLCWSVTRLERTNGVAIKLTISLQTALLDTQPSIALLTRLGAASPLSPDITRVCDSEVSAFVAVHSSDSREAYRSLDAGVVTLRFSPPFLEKGVIRSCRAAAFFLPGSPAESEVRLALSEFEDEPLPLTT